MNIRCLGVFREITNSPNRESDDALILKAVTEKLTKLGAETHLIEPGSLDLVKPGDWDVILPMCENYPALVRLMQIGAWKNPPLMLNHPKTVLGCYRNNMSPVLMNSCPEIFPRTEMRYIKDIPGKTPSFYGNSGAPFQDTQSGVWIKRGDVHNTCDHDVVYLKNWQDAAAVRDDFESREITSVVIQEHIAGDLIKFYGVGPYKWFDWFYHNPRQVSGYRFELKQLEKCTAVVAKAVGLEIYGGDAIVTPEGRICVIDINSWPSFARVKNTACINIARYVQSRVLTRILPSASGRGNLK